MNFLGHAYLSPVNTAVLAGNFFGDFVKGTKFLGLPNDIVKGVKLHRAIDVFTDEHKGLKEVRVLLRPKYGLYSGVVSDMFIDHYLATNWNQYHDQVLDQFTAQLYLDLAPYVSVFPEKAKYAFEHMSTNNWLANYEKVEGLDWAFKGLARRSGYKAKISEAAFFYDQIKDLSEPVFHSFLVDIKAFLSIKAF